MLAALVRPIFAAEDREAAREQLCEAVTALEARLPKVAAMLEAAEEDVLAFYGFPAAPRRKLRSTDESVNPSTCRFDRISGDRSCTRRSCRPSDRLLWPRFGPQPAEVPVLRGRRGLAECPTPVTAGRGRR